MNCLRLASRVGVAHAGAEAEPNRLSSCAVGAAWPERHTHAAASVSTGPAEPRSDAGRARATKSTSRPANPLTMASAITGREPWRWARLSNACSDNGERDSPSERASCKRTEYEESALAPRLI